MAAIIMNESLNSDMLTLGNWLKYELILTSSAQPHCVNKSAAVIMLIYKMMA